jgi:hypothetical protein
MPEDLINNHLDEIDRELAQADITAAVEEYEAMRQAHKRGDITDAELRKFPADYDRTIGPALFPHVPCWFLSAANRTEEVTL